MFSVSSPARRTCRERIDHITGNFSVYPVFFCDIVGPMKKSISWLWLILFGSIWGLNELVGGGAFYPDRPTLVGVMDGEPSLAQILNELQNMGVARVTLAPFLLLAGLHARRDMAGDHPGSWKMTMRRAGLEVDCVLRGLGALDAWAAIYVQHIKDAMREHGIK